MAVVGVEKILVDEVTRTRDGLSGRRVYVVRSDDGSEVTSLLALTASGVPEYGDAYDGSTTNLRASSIAAQAADGWDFRLVDVTYTENQIVWQENPLDEPDSISWTWQEVTETYALDRSSPDPLPVVTSAGQPFRELPQREGFRLVANIRRNVASFDFSAALSYQNAINSDTFTVDGVSVGVRQAKLNVVGVSEVKKKNGVSYRELTIQLKFRGDWRDSFADRGTKQLVSGDLVPILAGDPPQPIDDDWPLDGSGAAKASSTDTPAVLTFKPYDEVSFAAWNFQ